MGIHIIPKILGKTVVEDGYGYIENKRYNDFDSIRCTGDADFIYSEEIEWVYKIDGLDYEDGYRRPREIKKAKSWVQKNIPENNKNRLIKLLNDIEQNKNLWISVSY